MTRKTPVTLVTGSTAGAREAAIAAMIAADSTTINHNSSDITAIILEGMPHGVQPFETIANNSSQLSIESCVARHAWYTLA